MVFKDISFIPRKIKNVRKKAFKLVGDLEKNGFEERLVYGLYEALKNASEHGNKEDLSSRIYFKKDINENYAEFVISDEGTSFDKSLFDYLKHIEDEGFRSKSFYDFNNIVQAQNHGGAGVKLLYSLFDFINYAQNEKGGLELFLVKFK